MPWVKMAMAVGPITIIARDVSAPIRMPTDPDVNVTQPHRVTDEPDISRAQIIILVTHEADVFITVPVIIIGDGRHLHRRWSDHHADAHAPIRLHDTTCPQRDNQGHQTGKAQGHNLLFTNDPFHNV